MHKPQSFRQAFNHFKDRRLVTIFFFGIASGFPWVMIGSAMSTWLKDEGLSRSSIGLFGLIFVAYTINFLWSPLVDRIKLPVLTALLGQRRSWILATQIIVFSCTLAMYFFDVTTQLATIALLGFILALASATQDIAIDAYRIDVIGTENGQLMSASSAMATSGWWTGFAGLGSIPLALSDLPNWQWPEVYLVLAGIMLLLTTAVIFAREPQSNRQQLHQTLQQFYLQGVKTEGRQSTIVIANLLMLFAIILYASFGFPAWPEHYVTISHAPLFVSIFGIVIIISFARQLTLLHNKIKGLNDNSQTSFNVNAFNKTQHTLAWLLVTLIAPIHEFFNRNGVRFALSILLFIFLFKLGEAFLGRMSIVFYKEVGFSNTDIAIYSKMMNWWVTIVFSLIGSVFTIRYGIIKGLFIGGIAMASSNLLFSVIAIVGPSKPLFAITVLVDGFTAAWGSVAFVSLLSVLCNKAFTASQYALMASLGTFGRVLLGSYSGIMVDWLNGNWSLFFILTALMVIPSMLFLYSIRKPLQNLIDQAQKE